MAGTTVDVVSAVEGACLAGAEAALRDGGFVPRPQVHMFIDDWDQPYAGYVTTRQYYRGGDAITAILRLADAPAAIAATRVMLAWEEADLQASLKGPGDYPNGLAVAIAALAGGHTMRWHPFQLHFTGSTMHEWPSAEPEWSTPSTVPDAVLPPVMAAVLDLWRSLDGEPNTVFAGLVAEGFGVNLVQR